MGDVARHHHRAGQRQTGLDRELRQLRPDVGHRAVQVDPHHLAAEDVVGGFGEIPVRVRFELFEEHAIRRDLRADLSVGAARDADPHRQAGAVAGQADHAHVVAEILAAELRADADVPGHLQHRLFHLEIAERAAGLAAGRRQRVQPFGRGEFHRLQCRLGTGAADDDGEVVGRAGRGAERLDLRLQELRPASPATECARVSWNRNVLLAGRRPWRRTSGGTRRHGRSPGAAAMSNCTGRLLPVLTSSNIDSGAICE